MKNVTCNNPYGVRYAGVTYESGVEHKVSNELADELGALEGYNFTIKEADTASGGGDKTKKKDNAPDGEKD